LLDTSAAAILAVASAVPELFATSDTYPVWVPTTAHSVEVETIFTSELRRLVLIRAATAADPTASATTACDLVYTLPYPLHSVGHRGQKDLAAASYIASAPVDTLLAAV